MQYLATSGTTLSETFQSYNEEMIYGSEGATEQNAGQSPCP